MNKILEELKAVQGVSGVLILDLESLLTHQLLPASFDRARLGSLTVNLLALCEKAEGPVGIDLKFNNGAAFLAKLNHSAILIYGRPSLNLSLLKLVLKSSARTIERSLLRKREQSKGRFEDKSSTPLVQMYVRPLVEAMNQIASVYKKYIGTYPLTQNLREAKGKLSKEFPFLTNFAVDNTGLVSAIKGGEDLVREDVVLSFSRWASLLTEFCQRISPETKRLDIRELTKDSAQKLEEIGFYQLYEK